MRRISRRTRLLILLALLALVALILVLRFRPGRESGGGIEREALVGPLFNADSAYMFIAEQCSFGPRVMNSAAHDLCGEYIAGKFRQYGLAVTLQRAVLRGYDGTALNATNIIARYREGIMPRVLLSAHWDSRPWADNDPDTVNWRKPLLAANDGASGVAVMIELSRIITLADSLSYGIDFVCFDAEDWGAPAWSDVADEGEEWALGAAYWSERIKDSPCKPRAGILFDMVGGEGARFYREGVSVINAEALVERVWRAAHAIGYGSFFPMSEGGMITDDHAAVNNVAGIPCVDIIPYYPDCPESNFGPTWHTVSDDTLHIQRTTLKAVGQTAVQILYTDRLY